MGEKNVKADKSSAEPGPEWQPRTEETLGAYLRRIRLLRGMDLGDISDITPKIPESQHVSQPYLSQIELGRALHPSRERLISLAHALGLPEKWVLEKAGLIGATQIVPEPPTPSPLAQQISLRAAQLDPSDQEAFLRMIDAVLRLRRAKRSK